MLVEELDILEIELYSIDSTNIHSFNSEIELIEWINSQIVN